MYVCVYIRMYVRMYVYICVRNNDNYVYTVRSVNIVLACNVDFNDFINFSILVTIKKCAK